MNIPHEGATLSHLATFCCCCLWHILTGPREVTVSSLALRMHTHCFPQLCDSACLSNRWCLCVRVSVCVCLPWVITAGRVQLPSRSCSHTHRHYTIIDAPFTNSNMMKVFYRLTFNIVVWRQATMFHCSELWLENPTHEPKHKSMQQLP